MQRNKISNIIFYESLQSIKYALQQTLRVVRRTEYEMDEMCGTLCKRREIRRFLMGKNEGMRSLEVQGVYGIMILKMILNSVEQRFPTFLTRGALFRINFYGAATQAYPMCYKLMVFRSSVTGGEEGIDSKGM